MRIIFALDARLCDRSAVKLESDSDLLYTYMICRSLSLWVQQGNTCLTDLYFATWNKCSIYNQMIINRYTERTSRYMRWPIVNTIVNLIFIWRVTNWFSLVEQDLPIPINHCVVTQRNDLYYLALQKIQQLCRRFWALLLKLYHVQLNYKAA